MPTDVFSFSRRRWMIIVTAEEKERAANVPGIELISMEEMNAFLD